MPLRPLRLSTDLRVGAEILPLAFQYPESETWGIQADEQRELLDTIDNLARIWPLLRIIQAVSPALKYAACGYVWEEDGRPVGIVHFRRQGIGTWHITTVAVIPGYRRRGIGRQLVQASLDFIAAHRGGKVTLDVVAGNAPAYALYEGLGFHCFGNSTVLTFECAQGALLQEPALPDRYTALPLRDSDWQAEYEMVRRVTPPDVQAYQPVEEDRFRCAGAKRLVKAVLRKASGVQEEKIIVGDRSTGQSVGLARYSARIRPGGVNRVEILVDPEHTQTAPWLVHHALHAACLLSPGRRTEMEYPHWQDAALRAAYAVGCIRRMDYQHLGMMLQTTTP